MKDVEVIADSINAETGDRITSVILHRFPKCLQAQLNTHRVFSKNSASSRAIPVKKMIQRVVDDPFIPTWTKNKRGMSGDLVDDDTDFQFEWLDHLNSTIKRAEKLAEMGAHKQNVNRLLEPFARIPILVTATEWDNFFDLRCNHDTQPEFQEIAIQIREEMKHSKGQILNPGDWHIPFTPLIPLAKTSLDIKNALKVATARAARISYTTHDGQHSLERDLELHHRLLKDKHLSPFEHCAIAIPMNEFDHPTANFRGWQQYRTILEIDKGFAP